MKIKYSAEISLIYAGIALLILALFVNISDGKSQEECAHGLILIADNAHIGRSFPSLFAVEVDLEISSKLKFADFSEQYVNKNIRI